MLPNGLQHLTALRQLLIGCCPQLERPCKRDRGEDWPKIAHIPNININPTKVSQEDKEENSQRSITRSIKKLKLTSCTGRG
ncbi:putative disease resistance protein RGA2-like [Cocos nucifera]|uniref:Putative disease resistance protein RGA2-like n=1 Tax=Cocos nucifera TaxID=13894 RepID=A0A8K0MXQ5_COCNU|nr:putative disease resistance protein RGA2-like [Cocos nucifera]